MSRSSQKRDKFLNAVELRFRWYFLGSKLLKSRYKFHQRLAEGAISTRFTHPGREQVLQEEPQCSLASSVCLCVHSHTHKNQGRTWNMISESHCLPLLSLTNMKSYSANMLPASRSPLSKVKGFSLFKEFEIIRRQLGLPKKLGK